MHVDTPATIAILGAGPIGLEAALYARFLGYDVKLFERDHVAENVRRWGHVRMFSPFGMNASPLGLQALAAQDASYPPPAADELLTGDQWRARYLLPLSQSDLIVDGLLENTRVIAVGRRDFRKGECIGNERRADSPFRILVEDADGERDELADVVIDTTGTFGNHRWLGRGGVPAMGERKLEAKIQYGLPDILGAAKNQYLGRNTLVVGSGYSAATSIVALAELCKEDAKTQIAWLTKPVETDRPPLPRLADDRLPARDELAAQANALASGDGRVTVLSNVNIEAITYEGQSNSFTVKLTTETGGTDQTFDNIIANVGYRPDASLYEELQVHQCYASGGPMKLAAALLAETSADCLDHTNHGAGTLLCPEPNFYILGSKSYGRNSHFLVALGLEQIREVFSLIGGRANLNLYAPM